MPDFKDPAYQALFRQNARPEFHVNPAIIDLDKLSNGGVVHNGCGDQLQWGFLVHDPGAHGNVHVLECSTCRAKFFHPREEVIETHRSLNIP